ncbi:BRD4-interacting chromatin-remodeling complex-associated protein isoform X2 [Helicoverpa armigera]|uniref:BRD4-interacting chromatin-remodeling complex-associated protein isoform X2 n=1 Tax=Helicoverpa armigera TaxID=29058 RepID=UPI0021129D8D|nr:BRD4-interacting chromatin-remodeling complex-associated protein isoform X2 [Helicoverpa armigera]
MSSNLDNDRSLTNKMHPIDLAPQKITIVKSVTNSEMKMAHLIPGQAKTTGSSQIIAHASPGTGLMRPGLAQIISSNVASQPQMIISGSPILQGAQIVSQGSQLINQNTQIMSQSQLISPSGPIISPGTQIISQGTQLSAQVSSSNNAGSTNVQANVTSTVSGTQVLNVGGQLVSGSGNLVVNSSVRTLPPTVRVLPPLPHHNNRPAVLSSVNVSSTSGVLVSKSVGVGVTSHVSHVPRGLAAGASLAVRPVTPASNSQAASASGVISGAGRAIPPRAPTPTPVATAPRPLPLLQRNYQPAKVVGVASVGVRGVVGNSAPTQLYYEVPRGSHASLAAPPPAHPAHAPHQPVPRALAPYLHQPAQSQTQVTVVNAVSASPESRVPVSSVPTQAVLPRPSILRKRDLDGSPSKSVGYGRSGWEDVPVGAGGPASGSTTISASSSPAPDTEPDPPRPDPDLSPRKKPRKQILSNEVRQCDYQGEEPPPTPPPVTFNPPPKRPLLSSSYVCGWRSTALHFTRPSDVRRREPRSRDIVAIASQKHVLTSAEGWKVHHLTAQMDDLMSLESDVGEQLAGLLRALETASGRALSALQPHSHTLLELLKGNIQRSKIVCEGIQEAREDILRVFTHRNFVSDILTRQADKRCFRKHRSQS